MSLSVKFEQLMRHLNSEENEMANEFLAEMEKKLSELEEDSNHLRMLINRGVDNWDGYVSRHHEECDECGMDEDDCECGGDQ